MGTKIKFRRGSDANLPTLDIGEPGYTDSGKLYVGTANGNVQLAAQGQSANLTEQMNGLIETPSQKSYVLDVSASFAYAIQSFSAMVSSGSCTIKLFVNDVEVAGSNVTLGSTLTTQSFSSLNTVAIGSSVRLTVTSVFSASDLSFVMKMVRL